MQETITITLPEETRLVLDDVRREEGVSLSELVSEAIKEYLTRGVCSGVLEHCIRRHRPVTAEYILNELRGHMTRKSCPGQQRPPNQLGLPTTILGYCSLASEIVKAKSRRSQEYSRAAMGVL